MNRGGTVDMGRMSTRRRMVGFAVAISCLLLAAACGGEDEAPGGSGGDGLESKSLSIILPTTEFDSLMNAEWIEALKAEGIEIEVLEFEDSPSMMRALASGEGDIAVESPLPFLQYISKTGEDIKVIAGEMTSTDYALGVTADIEELGDLAGKRIGISTPGDISDTLTRLALDRAGYDVSQSEFVQIGGTSDRIAALLSNQIEAGAMHMADALNTAEQSDVHLILEYADHIPQYLQHVMATEQAWLDENPNLAQFVVDKFIESNRWAAENKDEYLELGGEITDGLSQEAMETAYDFYIEIGYFGVNGGLEEDLLTETAATEFELGTLETDMSTNVSEWADRTYVDDFLERNGEWDG